MGCHLGTCELSPISCIRLHKSFRKLFHSDLNASESQETTTIFANFFQWLTSLTTNSLEFIANFNLSGFNFYTVFIILFLAGSRNHLGTSIFSL